LARGEVGVGQATVAARALQDLPVTGDRETDRAAVAELDRLVAAEGQTQDRRQLGRTVDEWASRRDGNRLAERERRAFLRRHLWAGHDRDGQPLIEGRLTPIVLAKLGAVLDPLAGRAGDDDDRTIGQRRHDALETVLDRAAAVTTHYPDPGPRPERPDRDPHPRREPTSDPDVARTPVTGGPVGSFEGGRAQVLLITTPDAVHDHPAAAASELDGFGPVSSDTARQVCCDADITTGRWGRTGRRWTSAPPDGSPPADSYWR